MSSFSAECAKPKQVGIDEVQGEIAIAGVHILWDTDIVVFCIGAYDVQCDTCDCEVLDWIWIDADDVVNTRANIMHEQFRGDNMHDEAVHPSIRLRER